MMGNTRRNGEKRQMLQNKTRERLVAEYQKTHNAKKVAATYGVSVSTVYRLAKQKATTGTVKLQVSRRGRKRALSESDLARIDELLQTNPKASLREIVENLNLDAGSETVRRAIKRMGYSYSRRTKVRHISKRKRMKYIENA